MSNAARQEAERIRKRKQRKQREAWKADKKRRDAIVKRNFIAGLDSAIARKEGGN